MRVAGSPGIVATDPDRDDVVDKTAPRDCDGQPHHVAGPSWSWCFHRSSSNSDNSSTSLTSSTTTPSTTTGTAATQPAPACNEAAARKAVEVSTFENDVRQLHVVAPSQPLISPHATPPGYAIGKLACHDRVRGQDWRRRV